MLKLHQFNSKGGLSVLLSFLRAVLARASKDSICGQLATYAPLFSAQRWIYSFPAMYGLWRELRSVPLRILDQHARGLFYAGLDVGKIGRECHPQDSEYRIRIEGIQNLHKLRTYTTQWDEMLYVQGLSDGVELSIRMGKLEREPALSMPHLSLGSQMSKDRQ